MQSSQLTMLPALEFLQTNQGTVTLCGSTRFFFEAMEANRRLTHLNWLVWQCGGWEHSFHKYSPYIKGSISIKLLHLHKIYLSDIIVVVSDSTLYSGHSTEIEIQYADYLEKPVIHFNGVEFSGEVSKYFRCNRRAINEVVETFIDSHQIVL